MAITGMTISGVTAINYGDLSQKLHGDTNPTWDEQVKALKVWCEANDAYYYGAPRESFNQWEAAKQAKMAGKTVVVLDDLS